MWTLTGFADEISPDVEIQCSTLDSLGIGHIEVRSAWSVNVLDLDDDQLARVRETLDAHRLRTSSIGSPIGKIAIEEDFESHLGRVKRALRVARAPETPHIRPFS